MPTLTGKIAVISGGTTGIGLAIAQRQAHLDEAARLIGQRYDHSGRRLEWG